MSQTPTLSDIERALDEGRLWWTAKRGNPWVVRRNGATKLWKTRPGEFRIPIKAGLRTTGAVEHDNLHLFEIR